MIRKLLIQKGRWASNYAAFNISKCSYSNPVSLSQRTGDFDLVLKTSILKNDEKLKTETGLVDVSTVVDKMKKIGYLELTAREFVKKYEEDSKNNLKSICDNLDVLTSKGIQMQTILKNPWLLELKTTRLSLSLSLIAGMEPTSTDDFIPFVKLQPMELIKIQQMLLQEKAKVPGRNRVYGLSRLLDAEPIVMSEVFVRYPRLFWKKFEAIEEVVKVLRDSNVTSEDIIKSPYILFRGPNFIQKQFKKFKDMGFTDLKPKYLFINDDRLKAKVKNMNDKTIQDLLSERLECAPDLMSSYLESYKSLLLLDKEKLNKKLDYLLDEARIAPNKILSSLKILTFSLELIHERLEKLRAMDHEPQLLSVVCVSNKNFEKYLKRLGETEENVQL